MPESESEPETETETQALPLMVAHPRFTLPATLNGCAGYLRRREGLTVQIEEGQFGLGAAHVYCQKGFHHRLITVLPEAGYPRPRSDCFRGW